MAKSTPLDADGAEHIEPTRWSRTLVFAELLAIPASMFGGFWLAYRLLRMHTNDCSAICDQLLKEASGILAAAFLMLAFALQLLRHGWRIWTSQQVPAPGESVFFRRLIKRGPSVRVHALASVLMGITFLVVDIWFVFSVEQSGSLLAPCG
jgi:hypothetical protein